MHIDKMIASAGGDPLALPIAMLIASDRATIGLAIETLIAHLDTLDGDVDLEDSEAGNTDVDERGHFLGYAPVEHDEDCEAGNWAEKDEPGQIGRPYETDAQEEDGAWIRRRYRDRVRRRSCDVSLRYGQPLYRLRGAEA